MYDKALQYLDEIIDFSAKIKYKNNVSELLVPFIVSGMLPYERHIDCILSTNQLSKCDYYSSMITEISGVEK